MSSLYGEKKNPWAGLEPDIFFLVKMKGTQIYIIKNH